jgi:hypothetical protein
MDYIAPDWFIYGTLALNAITILLLFMVFLFARNYIRARFRKRFRGGHMVLGGDTDAELDFLVLEKDAGWLRGAGDFEITGPAERGPDCDMFIAHRRMGFTVPLPVLKAITALIRMGFKNLEQAVKQYDELYILQNQATIQEAINADMQAQKGELLVKKYTQAGRQALINLEWITPFTLPLSLVYSWALQQADSQNNELIVERAELKAEKKARQALSGTERLLPYAIFFVIIMVGGALAYNMLPQHSTPPTTTTAPTTTAPENTTTAPTTTTTTTAPGINVQISASGGDNGS